MNKILYGPPGTGKTFTTRELAVKIIDSSAPGKRKDINKRYKELKDEGRIEFVTFHQSYGYEEFIEGIRPGMSSDGKNISYSLKDGIFKRICERAKKPKDDNFDEVLKKLRDLVEDNPQSLIDLETPVQRKKFSIIGQTEDTFRIKPEISNQWLPVDIRRIKTYHETGEIDPYHENYYHKSYVKGIYEYMGEKMGLNTRNTDIEGNYVLIIDEINRGNISKILGELITLLEKDKRLGNGEELTVTLPYSQYPFGVPNNLYIIGTMNTADRSIAFLDTALRRRFDFEEMMPDYWLLEEWVGTIRGINIATMLEKMNENIIENLDRDHQIGHSYFLKLSQYKFSEDYAFAKLGQIFKNNIIPLLREYFFDQNNALRKVLGEVFFSDNNILEEDDLREVLDEPNNYPAIYKKEKKVAISEEKQLSTDSLPSLWVRSKGITKGGADVSLSKVWKAFSAWAEAEGHGIAFGRRFFQTQMISLGFRIDKNSSGSIYMVRNVTISKIVPSRSQNEESEQ